MLNAGNRHYDYALNIAVKGFALTKKKKKLNAKSLY